MPPPTPATPPKKPPDKPIINPNGFNGLSFSFLTPSVPLMLLNRSLPGAFFLYGNRALAGQVVRTAGAAFGETGRLFEESVDQRLLGEGFLRTPAYFLSVYRDRSGKSRFVGRQSRLSEIELRLHGPQERAHGLDGVRDYPQDLCRRGRCMFFPVITMPFDEYSLHGVPCVVLAGESRNPNRSADSL